MRSISFEDSDICTVTRVCEQRRIPDQKLNSKLRCRSIPVRLPVNLFCSNRRWTVAQRLVWMRRTTCTRRLTDFSCVTQNGVQVAAERIATQDQLSDIPPKYPSTFPLTCSQDPIFLNETLLALKAAGMHTHNILKFVSIDISDGNVPEMSFR